MKKIALAVAATVALSVAALAADMAPRWKRWLIVGDAAAPTSPITTLLPAC